MHRPFTDGNLMDAKIAKKGTAMLSVKALTKAYGPQGAVSKLGRHLAIKGITFDVKRGELFTLLGPSGCGKSTTLRAIAGLEDPNSGHISVAGRVLFDDQSKVNLPANRRELGMIFQSYAIWPHMTVFQNVSFPLEVMVGAKRPSRTEIRDRVEQVLNVVDLISYQDRSATKLSGGQQQRLAVARAMITKPELMLLDEPLSNLDAKLRETMRLEFKRMHKDLNITSIYVTHDQDEALAMSDRIAVMNEGEIIQVGSPEEIYNQPANEFVAQFVGISNIIRDVPVSRERGCVVLMTSHGTLRVPVTSALPSGNSVTISIRPENITLSEGAAGSEGADWSGRIAASSYHGDCLEYLVISRNRSLRVRSHPSARFAVGSVVRLEVAPDVVTIVPG